MSKSEKLVIIDGNALLHRAWHALPLLQTKDGRLVNAVYGFLLVFLKVIKDLKPSHIVVTFDRKETTFRHEVYEAYKATREKQPDELYAQIPILKKVLQSFRVAVVEAAGYEADDVIGTISSVTSKKQLPVVIVTGDLDTLQLVNDWTTVYTLRRGLTDSVLYDTEAVKERYNLSPEQLVDFRALKGDVSDNLPGVKGIGEKTASELIKTFKTLKNLYHEVEENNLPQSPLTLRLRDLLLKFKKEALMTKELSAIKCDVPIVVNIDDYIMLDPDMELVIKQFQDLEFKSLLSKLPFVAKKDEKREPLVELSKKNNYILVEEKNFDIFLAEIKKVKYFAVDTETTGLDAINAELLGVSFSWKNNWAYYVNLDHEPKLLASLKMILEDEEIKKWGHNLKYDINIFAGAGIQLKGVIGDTMIGAYLLNPGSRAYDLDTLSFIEFGHRKTPITKLIGEEKKSQRQMREVPLKELSDYSCADADFTWRLAEHYENELKKVNLWALFEKIEVPLIPVLATVERNGIKLDSKVLNDLSRKVTDRLKVIEQKIYKVAGQEFNVASPKQLKEILFEKLKLSSDGISKTKTGFSTAATELEKMRGQHEIIENILEHRELAKLQSTYLEALPKIADKKTQRIHTSFNQTITTTGRLSSSEPNLQNIPIRTELGAQVRTAFVAEKGKVLLSADYSQIELRVVASLADDKVMQEIFNKREDIHRATAAKINGVSQDEVTKAMRYSAKEVNFGVIYGMGPWGLASRTGMSKSEAKEFIDRYFKAFAGVKKYLEEIVVLAKELGYVETMFGRRRYLPELNSGVVQVRQAAERMAVNMPIQGTAADIIKLAMIAIDKKLSEVSSDTKMVLQVHDELLFEVPENQLKTVAEFVKLEMENIVKLKVPIEVNIKAGQNWGTMEVL